MTLCTINDVKAFLLNDYITAAEELNKTIVTDTIAKVSGEITDLLSSRYKLTSGALPQVIINIAAVFSAYRIVEAITGIVNTESGAENVWIPLQKEYQRMDRLLNEIAKGTLKLTLPEVTGGKTVAVVNPDIELKGY